MPIYSRQDEPVGEKAFVLINKALFTSQYRKSNAIENDIKALKL